MSQSSRAFFAKSPDGVSSLGQFNVQEKRGGGLLLVQDVDIVLSHQQLDASRFLSPVFIREGGESATK